jgi:mono/diheme cytochrome c family protein
VNAIPGLYNGVTRVVGWSVGTWIILGTVAADYSRAQEVGQSKLPAAAADHVDFARDIKPLLDRSCMRCHGSERPKSRFSLSSRAAALRGGTKGIDIVPRDSARSLLVQFVAGLVEEMEMPPNGKGEPLSSQEVAKVRAWIDQGVSWDPDTPEPAGSIAAVPIVGGTAVKGDYRKFREQFWVADGWNGGLETFSASRRLGTDSELMLSGRALREDYRLSFELKKNDLGFARFGWEQYRKYYDDSGGYIPTFTPSVFRLNQELYQDIGHAWTEFGIMLPDWPTVVIGYEYQYRRGNEATLEWGQVNATVNDATTGRNVYPSSKSLDEHVHVIKLDLHYELLGAHLSDSFRGQFYQIGTQRENPTEFILGNSSPSKIDLIKEGYNYFQGANTLRVEKPFTDWFLASAGYLYSKLDADAAFSLDSLFPLGSPGIVDSWRSEGIVLERQTHSFNATGLLGPWKGLSLSGGVLNEWTHQEGFGNGAKDFSIPSIPFSSHNPVAFDSSYDQYTIEESVALRYTSIPFTALFAEARLRQQSIGEFEQEIAGPEPFLRNTKASNDLRDIRAGFNTSPLQPISFTGQVRRYESDTDYNHIQDESVLAYPAFILSRNVLTHEAEARLTFRPTSYLQTSLVYRYERTRYDTSTEAANLAGPGEVSPGGSLQAAHYSSRTYSANATFFPLARLSLSGTFSYQKTSMAAFNNNDPSLVPYRGDVFTVLANSTYAISTNSDFQCGYSFSRADYAQNNFSEGLPLGIYYTRNVLSASVGRRFSRSTSARLQYAFYHYDEPSSGGANNFSAHAIFGTFVLTLP